MKIGIEYLSDTYDCDDCGTSWADGYRVYKDGELWFEMTPLAHCFGGTNFEYKDLFEEIMLRLGHEVVDQMDETLNGGYSSVPLTPELEAELRNHPYSNPLKQENPK
jgi:hypothetical protein